jgi:chemotaxis protein CheC
MTLLTESQQDSLTEIINIAFSRAAASLSDLTQHRVLLNVPKVSIHPMNELQGILSEFVQDEIATVHQIFDGSLSGDAMLMLDYEGAVKLSRLLTEGNPDKIQLYESDREVLNEVGNILLNACLGTFGNMLEVQITFSVPRLNLADLETLLDSLLIGKDEIQYTLVIYTRFNIEEREISGYLLIVMGVTSLERLLGSLEKLG